MAAAHYKNGRTERRFRKDVTSDFRAPDGQELTGPSNSSVADSLSPSSHNRPIVACTILARKTILTREYVPIGRVIGRVRELPVLPDPPVRTRIRNCHLAKQPPPLAASSTASPSDMASITRKPMREVRLRQLLNLYDVFPIDGQQFRSYFAGQFRSSHVCAQQAAFEKRSGCGRNDTLEYRFDGILAEEHSVPPLVSWNAAHVVPL